MSLAIQTELKEKAATPAEGLVDKVTVRHLNFYYGHTGRSPTSTSIST